VEVVFVDVEVTLESAVEADEILVYDLGGGSGEEVGEPIEVLINVCRVDCGPALPLAPGPGPIGSSVRAGAGVVKTGKLEPSLVLFKISSNKT
jgi:hypothetical protein